MCPVGNDTEILAGSNGGVTASLPKSSVQITVSDFNTTVAQPTATAQAGKSATYSVTVGSQFGAFSNPVSLSCSGLPSLASCSFSPPTVTPGSGSATSTLTISTTAPSLVFPTQPNGWPSLPIFAAWMGLVLILLISVVNAKKTGRKLAASLAFTALLVCVASPIVACSGNNGSSGSQNPGTPTGTYTVTVTGTANQLQHSTSVTLKVQ